MLYECKQYNKFSNRIKKYNKDLETIKNNINILKKYLSKEKPKNTNENNSINNSIKDNPCFIKVEITLGLKVLIILMKIKVIKQKKKMKK